MVDSAKLDRKQTKTDSASHDKSKQREFEQKVAKVTKRNQGGVWKMILGESTNTRLRAPVTFERACPFLHDDSKSGEPPPNGREATEGGCPNFNPEPRLLPLQPSVQIPLLLFCQVTSDADQG